jgi:hypothetical protein
MRTLLKMGGPISIDGTSYEDFKDHKEDQENYVK